jgi:hypothetical protein
MEVNHAYVIYRVPENSAKKRKINTRKSIYYTEEVIS